MGGTLADCAARDAEIVTLQARVFDHSGHPTAGLERADAERMVAPDQRASPGERVGRDRA
jgi:hypothetical protein